MRLAFLGLASLLAGFLVAGCGSGDRTAGSPTTALTGTRSMSLPERTATAEEAVDPVTATETQPADTEPQPTEPATTRESVTVVETQTILEPAPSATTEGSGATTTGISPAAVAGTAAVVMSTPEETSATDWGWVAFGILAAAVVVFGVIWWWRRRRGGGGGTPAPAGSGG